MVFGREPALFFALFAGVLNLALAFGLHLSVEQIGGLNAVMFAIVGFCIRQNVAPLPPKP